MKDDALAPFVHAYRQENPGAALDARAIRSRVLVGIGVRQRRKLLTLRFVLPIAATFFGSVALAASHGGLPRLDEVREWLGVAPQAPAASAETGRRARAAGTHRTPAPKPVVEVPEPAPADPAVGLSFDELPAEPVDTRREVQILPERALASRPAPPVEARPDPLKADLAVYQKAHQLHFHGGDPVQALAAWEAYLASYPRGTFAPEARFNRAVCMLRLGRRSEARSVLVPIAESSAGAYGRERARALLEAMGD
jgi:hypothetical protein